MKVYLGLGSNLGDSRQIVLDAAKTLEDVLSGLRSASLYETKPLYVMDQGSFINTVVEGQYALVQDFSPTASARALLSRLHEIEARFGRDRANERRWGERFLDIDILLFGDSIISEADITVPHPRLKERRFALEPLLELFPDAAEPGTGLFYSDFCAALPDHGVRLINLTTNHTNQHEMVSSAICVNIRNKSIQK
jgi:2-amino-4-hydroxy-6-hydroxymethyldihydropteridine diphosphokinase